MKTFRRIHTTTGDYIEDVRFESHPYLMELVTLTNYDEEGNPFESQVEMYMMTELEVDQFNEDGTVTKVMQEQPVLDPQYVEEAPPQGLYLPRYLNGVWIEGGTAPAPTTPQLSTDEKLTQMAEQLVITQTNLSTAQEALDFLLMGGM